MHPPPLPKCPSRRLLQPPSPPSFYGWAENQEVRALGAGGGMSTWSGVGGYSQLSERNRQWSLCITGGSLPVRGARVVVAGTRNDKYLTCPRCLCVGRGDNVLDDCARQLFFPDKVPELHGPLHRDAWLPSPSLPSSRWGSLLRSSEHLPER